VAETNETILIQRARQGDDVAWESLVRSHQEIVFRLAYLFLGDAGEAEDTAQESFIRAHRALGKFDATRPFRPWILSITANLARNRLRSIGRYLAVLRKFMQDAPQAGLDAEEQSSQSWQSRRLWTAVKQLHTLDQQVIYLRYFMDMSVEETAEAMDVAPGTVKSRLHRALARLRKVIEQDYPDLKDEPA
jgi:RNA polymerase sigma-70 factor, ECF subfamily